MEFYITYWAHGGTILGQVRHGGIIPWDDDIDIQLAPEEELKITVEVKNEFKKRGLSIQDFDLFGFKIAQINSPILDSAKKNWISIDVYISMKEKDVISLQKSDARKIWPLSYLYIDEIFPLKRVSFGPITIISINTPENHLSRRYGIDWKSYAFRLYVHATDSYMKPVKVKLETFSPADFSGFNY